MRGRGYPRTLTKTLGVVLLQRLTSPEGEKEQSLKRDPTFLVSTGRERGFVGSGKRFPPSKLVGQKKRKDNGRGDLSTSTQSKGGEGNPQKGFIRPPKKGGLRRKELGGGEVKETKTA